MLQSSGTALSSKESMPPRASKDNNDIASRTAGSSKVHFMATDMKIQEIQLQKQHCGL